MPTMTNREETNVRCRGPPRKGTAGPYPTLYLSLSLFIEKGGERENGVKVEAEKGVREAPHSRLTPGAELERDGEITRLYMWPALNAALRGCRGLCARPACSARVRPFLSVCSCARRCSMLTSPSRRALLLSRPTPPLGPGMTRVIPLTYIGGCASGIFDRLRIALGFERATCK